jgi:tetratricopeptide (TPR) repeat protein
MVNEINTFDGTEELDESKLASESPNPNPHRKPNYVSQLRAVTKKALSRVLGKLRTAHGLAGVVLIFFLLYCFFDETVVLEPFSAPKWLTDKGISGELLARYTADELSSMRRSLPLNIQGRNISVSTAQIEIPDVEIAALHVQLRDLVRFTRKLLRRATRTIQIELSGNEQRLMGRIRISRGDTILSITDFGLQDVTLRPMATQLAQELLSIEHPYAAAVYSFQQGKYEDALIFAYRATHTTDKNTVIAAYSLYGLIAAMLHLPDFDVYFSKSLGLQPQRAETHIYRAVALWQARQSEEAIKHLDAALITEPSNYSAHLLLGIYETPNDKGKDHLQRAIQIDKSNGAAYCELAHLLQETQSTNPDAIRMLAKCYELAPNYITDVSNQALKWLAFGSPQDGKPLMGADVEAKMNEFIKLNVADAQTYNTLGNAQAGRGALKEASSSFLKVVIRAPEDILGYTNFATVQEMQCEDSHNLTFCEQALSWFRRAEELQSRSDETETLPAHVYIDWGMALFELHEFADACKKLDLAVHLEPENSDALYFDAMINARNSSGG